MVSVAAKAPSVRRAVAEGELMAHPEICRRVRDGNIPKGDVLAVARVAAIMAAKRTADLIPLCHPIPLTGVEVAITVDQDRFRVRVQAETQAPTGVEMEAMTAVSVGLLTLYDMLKGLDRGLSLTHIRLLEKSGGRSGHFVREGQ